MKQNIEAVVKPWEMGVIFMLVVGFVAIFALTLVKYDQLRDMEIREAALEHRLEMLRGVRIDLVEQ